MVLFGRRLWKRLLTFFRIGSLHEHHPAEATTSSNAFYREEQVTTNGPAERGPDVEINEPVCDGTNAGRWKQYLAAFTVCLAAFGTGSSSGWASPMLLFLQSASSPVGVLSLKELSYLETIPLISSLVALFLFGFILDKFGRKPAGYISAVACIVGWILLLVATAPIHLFIGRFLTGFSGILGLGVAPIFLSEVVHPMRRGSMLCYLVFVSNLSIMVSYLLGDVLNYRLFNITCIIAPVLFPILFFLLPESPYFLVSKSKTDYAKRSLLWYRGNDQEVVSKELLTISNSQRTNSRFWKLFVIKSARRGLLINIFMFSFQQMGGSQIIQGYASLILEASGDPMDPNKSAVIVAATKLIASFGSVLLIERLGRRPLMLMSFFCMAICLTVMSTFLYIREAGINDLNNFTWIPLACLCTFNIASSVGVGTLPDVIGTEVIPPEFRGTSSIVSGTITIVLALLCLQAFPIIIVHIGMYGNFVYPAFVNFLGCVITYYLLPETRGKSFTDISKLLE